MYCKTKVRSQWFSSSKNKILWYTDYGAHDAHFEK